MSKHWVILSDTPTADIYLRDIKSTGYRSRWGRLEDALTFATKNAAELVCDIAAPGCIVLEVIDHDDLDAAARVTVEGARAVILDKIGQLNSKLVHQLKTLEPRGCFA